MNFVKKTLITGLLVAGFVPMLSFAYISDSEDRNVTVSFADLDLTREEGKAELYQRLENAARKVCGPVHVYMAGSLAQVASNQECFEETMASATEKLGISR